MWKGRCGAERLRLRIRKCRRPPSAPGRDAHPSGCTERMLVQCLTIRSCIEGGPQKARVKTSGPNSSRLGPDDFHVPRPRLQSMRAATEPSAGEGDRVSRSVVRRHDRCRRRPGNERAARTCRPADSDSGPRPGRRAGGNRHQSAPGERSLRQVRIARSHLPGVISRSSSMERTTADDFLYESGSRWPRTDAAIASVFPFLLACVCVVPGGVPGVSAQPGGKYAVDQNWAQLPGGDDLEWLHLVDHRGRKRKRHGTGAHGAVLSIFHP